MDADADGSDAEHVDAAAQRHDGVDGVVDVDAVPASVPVVSAPPPVLGVVHGRAAHVAV
jgi:hypothetical protein